MSSNGQADLQRSIPLLGALPRPLYARAESLWAGSWTARHRHPWVQLSYAISGVLGVHTAAGSFFAPPQWAVWVPAELEHEVFTSMHAEMRSLYIRRDACTWAPPRCRVLEVTGLTRELIKQFCRLPSEYPEGESAESRLVGVLLDQLAAAPEAGFSLPMPAEGRLRGLCGELLKQPDLACSLGEWARRANTSEKTLMRAFQRETGMSFRQWRRRLRLLSALQPLEGGASVTQAALGCGYESPSAFIAAFRELFGATPGELFRRPEGSG
ncbi:helix-turn-helix transcriptional regulator [Pseudomonas sp. RIT-PI-AD]|uniref:AraC family transcriptional regulator n=1 Tax=Pseudomonas sp. RIT-PI-AD TaxID=3035294 RepID=UPI0021D926E9|nr:helix-turn-helix transcriptional regulator [Pseudomonas sp. RIT-PI-AD]